jgi:hypothetical protein
MLASASATLERRDTPPPGWDDLVLSCTGATPFQMSGWLTAKATSDGAQAVYVQEVCGSFAAAGLLTRTSVPELYVPRGPVGVDAGAIVEACEALRARFPLARVRVGPYLALEGDGRVVEERLRELGFLPTHAEWHEATAVVALEGEDAMWASLSKGARYGVRRGERSGLSARADASDVAAAHFAALYEDFARRRQVRPVPRRFFTHLAEALRDGLGTFLLVEDDGDLCSAALLLVVGPLAWLSRTATAGGREPHGAFMQWQAMRWARARGCTCFDLGGLETNHRREIVASGLTRFKLSLGARPLALVRELALDQGGLG